MSAGRPRRRRKPEEAERAILAAARSLLEERPFREIRVEDIMARAGLSRPAFYAYFKDQYELLSRLLEGFGGLLFAVDYRWLSGDSDDPDRAREVLGDALRRGADTFLRYGPVLRAVSEAAGQNPRIEEAYRHGLLGRLAGAVAERISRDIAAGLSPSGLNPEETSLALVLMTERYLLDVFGDPEKQPSPEQIAAVTETVEMVWLRTLYAGNP